MNKLKIRSLVETEIPQLQGLTPPNWSGNVFNTFRFHFGKPNFIPIVAELNGLIVGCAYGLIHGKSAWLSHIIVLPAYRGQGIGTKLTSSLIDLMQSEGCLTLNLCATRAGVPLYEKLGFATTSTYTLLKRERSLLDRGITKGLRKYGTQFYSILPSFLRKQVLWKQTPHIRKVITGDYRKILRIDKSVTGEDRNKFLRQYLSNGWVYQNIINNQITGFYVEGFGNTPIHALDPQAGLELLTYKIGKGSSNICVPTENKLATKYLLNVGFRITEIQPRMTLGPSIAWNPEGVFNRGSGTG